MSTTPNYNWPLIENTDFVTNLPADLETLADAIDASFAADEGDLLVGTSGNIFAPLTIGANGTVLSSNGTTATWATLGAAGSSYTLLNTGGTALTGSGTITVSSINGYENYLIIVSGASNTGTGNPLLRFRLNGDSGTNYAFAGISNGAEPTYAPTVFARNFSTSSSFFPLCSMSTDAASDAGAAIFITGGKSTGGKSITAVGASNAFTGNFNNQTMNNGIYLASAEISSFTLFYSSGNFDAGTLFIYGSAN
jgi:hypothetical protein